MIAISSDSKLVVMNPALYNLNSEDNYIKSELDAKVYAYLAVTYKLMTSIQDIVLHQCFWVILPLSELAVTEKSGYLFDN